MAGNLNERFERVIYGVAAGSTQTSQAGSGTSDVTGSSVEVPAKPGPPLTYRVTLGGTKTGANAAMIVHLKLGATQVMSITADDGTAVDWVCEFLITFKDSKNQRIIGHFLADTADPGVDYAAGTVDCTAGATLKAQIQSQHASDTVTCEMVIVEKGE